MAYKMIEGPSPNYIDEQGRVVDQFYVAVKVRKDAEGNKFVILNGKPRLISDLMSKYHSDKKAQMLQDETESHLQDPDAGDKPEDSESEDKGTGQDPEGEESEPEVDTEEESEPADEPEDEKEESGGEDQEKAHTPRDQKVNIIAGLFKDNPDLTYKEVTDLMARQGIKVSTNDISAGKKKAEAK